ncbi:hypothetical protein [Clostridium butyricum]
MNNKDSRISFRVEKRDIEILEKYAFLNDCTISDIVYQALRKFFDDEFMFETSKERKEKLWKIN